jgi:hypothetical protein
MLDKPADARAMTTERDQQRLGDGARAGIKAGVNSAAPRPKRALPPYLPAVLTIIALMTIAWLGVLFWGAVKLLSIALF